MKPAEELPLQVAGHCKVAAATLAIRFAGRNGYPHQATEKLGQLEHGISLIMVFGIGLSSVLLVTGSLFAALGRQGAAALEMAGILVLVSTPAVRVVMCMHHFALEQDWRYVALTLWVLLAMLAGVAIGTA